MFKNNLVRTGLLFIVLTAGINLCFGQMYWTNSYDNSTSSFPLEMQPTKDGNYIITGFAHDRSITGWFAKINPNGDTLWTKTFGLFEFNQFNAIQSINGEFFLLVGTIHSAGVNGVNESKGWVTKINTKGDVIWTRTYEKTGKFLEFNEIQKCTDGNFLIAGISNEDEQNPSGCLFKITPDGDTLWTRFCSGSLFSILVTSDENYLVAGGNYNSVSKKDETLLLKINNSGKILWTRNFSNSWCRKIISSGNGNYLLLGQGNGDGRLVKITSEGDTIWSRTYSSPESDDSFLDIISTMDGGFLIIGNKFSNSAGFNEWFLKINQNGETLWTRTTSTGEYQYNMFTYILPADNGEFLVLGKTYDKLMICCMVEDQYAKKDSLLSFKIPTRRIDSLNCGYLPLKVPSGMTVSAGGTVSWTPHTDSSYLENAKFVIADDQGRKDTLSLNIFVNMKNQPSHTRTMHQVFRDKIPDVITIALCPQRGKVQFSFLASAVSLSIYDMSGRLIDQINPVSSTGCQTILWPANGTGFNSGQYIARAVAGKKTESKVFMLAR